MVADIQALDSVRFLFLLGILAAMIKVVRDWRVLTDKKLYYQFCQLRRDLMFLALSNRIKLDSISFQFYMRYLSEVIHYSDDHKFGTRIFLSVLKKKNGELARNEFLQKLWLDVGEQGPDAQLFVDRFHMVMTRSLKRNMIVWLILTTKLYRVLFKIRPTSSYTKTAGALISIKEHCSCSV